MKATIITPGERTERGTPMPDWDGATTTVEDGWRFVPVPAEESAEYARRGVVTKLKGSGPYDTALTELCRIEIESVVYEVVSSVDRWPSLTGDMAHSEVVLRHVSG